MYKKLDLHFCQPPEVPGFNDSAVLLEGDTELVRRQCSAGPNWIYGQDSPDKRWNMHYGYLATGLTFLGRCIMHNEYGKCLLYNDGCALLSSVPNPNHGGDYYVDQVFMHHSFPNAFSKSWRGSAACTTMPQTDLDVLLGFLAIDERVIVHTILGACQ